MGSLKISTELAPVPALERVLELLILSGFPKSEHIVDAERVIRASLEQARFLADFRQRQKIDPFGYAVTLMDEGYGLGVEQAHTLIRTDANVKRVHDCAIATIARLLNDRRG
jgi:hypothetical protein